MRYIDNMEFYDALDRMLEPYTRNNEDFASRVYKLTFDHTKCDGSYWNLYQIMIDSKLYSSGFCLLNENFEFVLFNANGTDGWVFNGGYYSRHIKASRRGISSIKDTIGAPCNDCFVSAEEVV